MLTAHYKVYDDNEDDGDDNNRMWLRLALPTRAMNAVCWLVWKAMLNWSLLLMMA